MAKYRSHSRIILDILRAIEQEGEAPVSRLLAAANLPHPRLTEYLADLVARGWVRQQDEPRRWSLTPSGQETLAGLARLEDAMADFGLPL